MEELSLAGRGAGAPPWRRLLVAVLALPLAAFFAFVGWYKTFAPMAELAAHGAWTAHVPVWIGRPMGWSELIGAALFAGAVHPGVWRWTRVAALWLAASQIVSAALHATHGESAALPQNLLLFAVLLALAALARPVTPKGN